MAIRSSPSPPAKARVTEATPRRALAFHPSPGIKCRWAGLYDRPVKPPKLPILVSRPVLNRMKRDIAESGGIEAILDRVASGELMGKIAEGFGVSRTFLSGFVNKTHKAQFAAARREAAATFAEQTVVIADEIPEGSLAPEVKRAETRINTRRWLASRYDPETFGEKQAPTVQLNFGDVHLSTLKEIEATFRAKPIAPAALPAPAEAAPINAEFEEIPA